MSFDNSFNIIGIDGGATSTRAVLFNDSGLTLGYAIGKGTNLNLYGKKAAYRISQIITKLCQKTKIDIEDIDAVGLGLAAASDLDGRDLVFRELDQLKLSKRSIIMNDAEAAFEIGCPGAIGLMVTVGTGVICLGKGVEGKIVRSAGRGHQNGDVGSGFWIGKQGILQLAMNESSIAVDPELSILLDMVLDHFNTNSLNEAIELTMNNIDSVALIASLTKNIIALAKSGHEISLSIIQKATTAVADYILEVSDNMKLFDQKIVLAGNGSVVRNDFYRNSLNDALKFDFSDIQWTFSTLSAAYGAGILASKLHDVNIHVPKLINGNFLDAANSKN